MHMPGPFPVSARLRSDERGMRQLAQSPRTAHPTPSTTPDHRQAAGPAEPATPPPSVPANEGVLQATLAIGTDKSPATITRQHRRRGGRPAGCPPGATSALITHRFAIEDAMEAFRMAQYKSKGVLRVIVSPGPTGRPQARRRPGSQPNLETDHICDSRKRVSKPRASWSTHRTQKSPDSPRSCIHGPIRC